MTTVWVGMKRFEVSETHMTGAKLKKLRGENPTYPLCRETGPNHWDHKYVGDGELVDIRDGHFFVMIPATTLRPTAI